MRLEIRLGRGWPAGWSPGRHPEDVFRTWDARPAPFLELDVPWAGMWNPLMWRVRFVWPGESWPCWQVVVGPVYVRVWRRGVTLYWNGYEPALMACSIEV